LLANVSFYLCCLEGEGAAHPTKHSDIVSKESITRFGCNEWKTRQSRAVITRTQPGECNGSRGVQLLSSPSRRKTAAGAFTKRMSRSKCLSARWPFTTPSETSCCCLTLYFLLDFPPSGAFLMKNFLAFSLISFE
jgi:hypothetical protein